jgi:ketosteroid isomerase-like protein
MDESQIGELVEEYRAGFASSDRQRLRAIWDRDHDGLIYVALEVAEPMYGWPAIAAYYDRLPSTHPADRVLEMRIEHPAINVLGDVATVFCRFHFVGEIAGQDDPFVADGRVTFVCRRCADGWAVVHYHESAPP